MTHARRVSDGSAPESIVVVKDTNATWMFIHRDEYGVAITKSTRLYETQASAMSAARRYAEKFVIPPIVRSSILYVDIKGGEHGLGG